MRFDFKKLHIESFLSIDSMDIVLADCGMTLVKGINKCSSDNSLSNGSGKSSIFEALIWVLTGTTSRGSKDVVNKYTDDGALVTLDFDVDSNHYSVTRTREHSKYKTNLFFTFNGEEKSGKGIRDSDKLLQQYLPTLTGEILSSVIVLGQGMPSKFTSNSPMARKEVLERLTNSDFMIEDLKERVKSRKQELLQIKQELNNKKIEFESKVSMLLSRRKEIEQKVQELKNSYEYEKQITQYNNDISLFQKEVDEYSEMLSNNEKALKANNETLSNLKNVWNNDKSTINEKYNDLLISLQSKIASLEATQKHLTSQITSIKNIVDICPTCGQKIQGVVKPDTTALENDLKKTQEEIRIEKSNLSVSVKEKETEIQKLSESYKYRVDELTRIIREIDSSIAQIKLDLSNSQRCLSTAKVNLGKAQTLSENRDSMLKENEEELSVINEQIESFNADNSSVSEQYQINESRLEVNNVFETVLKKDFRSFLIKDCVDFINFKCDDYIKFIAENASLKFVLEENNIEIYYNDKPYENLSGGEKQKVDIIVQLSLRDTLSRFLEFDSSLVVLDEIFDNLDSAGCEKIIDLLQTKLNIDNMFIISHHEDSLNLPYDNCITIVKDNNVSRLI